MPLTLEYFSLWTAAGIFLVLALPIVWLGRRSLTSLGPTRQWTAIALRLIVLLLFVLILGGARWQRISKELDVIVLRDVSGSTSLVHDYPDASKQTLTQSIDQYLHDVSDEKIGQKKPDDRIGVISFQRNALIDALPNPTLMLDARGLRKDEEGTDPAAAIQLGLATQRREAMHRMLLIWDGNKTQGDLDAALSAAAAQHVPIDVLPLDYNVTNEVLVESFNAPTMRGEKEPFSLNLVLRSTNTQPVGGTVTIYRQDHVMDTRHVTVNPGLNPYRFPVPAANEAGVFQFRATFDIDAPTTMPNGQMSVAGDTLSQNNSATAFTLVKGHGQTLFVDNTPGDQGDYLVDALARQGLEIHPENHIKPSEFPGSLVQLQAYDSVILANVSAGAGGLSDDQLQMLAAYVHDTGGGLLTIGGPDTYGAGGWQGKKIEDVLPVAMDIPAQRQIAKGALVLVFHSCEMPEGNYWGEQCGMKACETLSSADEIGVISYGWGNGPHGSGAQWDFPLKPKGDGTAAIAAIKQMQQGDMPDFEDTLRTALDGKNGGKGLKDSDARQKHIIIISDGDPSPPGKQLTDDLNAAKVTVSTISVYPHMGEADGLPPNMKKIAHDMKGKAYGPINANPNQLPQIFIKEATVVRRSLIQESLDPNPPIPVRFKQSPNDFMKGVPGTVGDSVRGMVLTSRKQNPQIDVPMEVGKMNDPLLAFWQAGLGRVATFMSDATPRWEAAMVQSGGYDKFWSQLLRAVQRPAMSTDFTMQTTESGGVGHIQIEAINHDNAFLNFLNFGGKVLGPDGQPIDVHIVQTGPGTYEATYDARNPGNYVVALNYAGEKGERGTLIGGTSVNQSPELRDLTSNDAALQQVADRTGGRVLSSFDPATADLFSRAGVAPADSPLPIWDLLVPFLLGAILLDVACRRIAWDWASIQRMLATARGTVQSYTTVRKGESEQTLGALKTARSQISDPSRKPPAPPGVPATDEPLSSRKFEADGVKGDAADLLGGATAEGQAPAKPPTTSPPPAKEGDTLGGLMEAKRRAQKRIRDKEEGKDG